MGFDLTGKNREKIAQKYGKSPQNREKSHFWAIFPIFGAIFPRFFPVRSKPIFGPFFSDFGRVPETDFLPGPQDRNTKPHTQILNFFNLWALWGRDSEPRDRD